MTLTENSDGKRIVCERCNQVMSYLGVYDGFDGFKCFDDMIVVEERRK